MVCAFKNDKIKNENLVANSQNKGKVLFIATVYNHLAAFHIPFMKMLQEKGYEVHAAASSAMGLRDDVENARVVCWEIPFKRSPYNPANVKAFFKLRSLLKNHHFDLIHVHTPVAAFLGRFLAKSTHQGPVLYTAHGFHFYKGAPRRNWLIYYTAERIASRWTDGLIVMNDEDFENAQKLGFKAGENLFYVHGVGVDLSEYADSLVCENNIRASLVIGQEDIIVTCVAELIERKNHDFLLDAWSELASRHDYIHLLFVGTGEKMATLQKRVMQEHLQRVYFLGYRRDVPQILSETDIATLVSKHEGLPRCIMEAMAAVKPVVASNARGNRDLVEHGRTGFLVELEDVSGLIQAFEKLILDRQLRISMGIAGQKKIRDYSLENVLAEMSDIYDLYLSRKSPGVES